MINVNDSITNSVEYEFFVNDEKNSAFSNLVCISGTSTISIGY